MDLNVLTDVLRGVRFFAIDPKPWPGNPGELAEGLVDYWAGVNPEEFKGQAAFQGGTS